VEVRLTAVETGVIRVQSDVSAIKERVGDNTVELRTLRESMDRRFQSMDTKFTHLFVWLISIMIASVGALLGTMAHGFHWL
jgi:hypothetical protein